MVVGPGEEFDFDDQLRPHPMHAAENQCDPKRLVRGGTVTFSYSQRFSTARKRHRHERRL
jgi:hypothetical protein